MKANMNEENKNLWEQILEDLHLNDLDEKSKKEALDKLAQIIFQRVFVVIFDRLDETAKDEFEKMANTGKATPDEMFGFLSSRIDNMEEIIKKEMEDFKSRVGSLLEAVKKV